MFKQIFIRDVRLHWSSGGSAASALGFFGMIYALMVMALGADGVAQFQHPLLAIAVLLTVILSLPALFDEDVQDGTLEQYLLMPVTGSMLMLSKIGSYWLAHSVPVLLLVCAIEWLETGSAWHGDTLRICLLSLWLSAFGALAAIIALLHGKGVFVRALVMIPLFMPALIFATLPEHAVATQSLQLAGTLFLLPLVAWIGGALLNMVVD